MTTSCIPEQVVVTDPDLLMLEFEAIVAASYPPSDGCTARRPPAVRRTTAVRTTPSDEDPCGHESGNLRIRPVGRRPHARQRSPPAKTSAYDRRRKGGS